MVYFHFTTKLLLNALLAKSTGHIGTRRVRKETALIMSCSLFIKHGTHADSCRLQNSFLVKRKHICCQEINSKYRIGLNQHLIFIVSLYNKKKYSKRLILVMPSYNFALRKMQWIQRFKSTTDTPNGV